ncbi:hypothetical protein FQN54_008967 [Arachnomyces sp. PD_36]|nr:hypothetical protein FQN54_008967 [Arachnomyces sp. PD_36]
MPPQITVVPASTKAGRETIRELLRSESKPQIRAIYRDISKAPAEFIQQPNFEAVTGDVGTGSGIDFSGSDVVFYIPPPIYDGTDEGEWANRTATNVKNAIRDAPSVKRLLLFSAIGSQNGHGIGILRLNHISETILKDAVPEVLVVRPSYFQEDFGRLLEAAQADPPVIHSWITPVDYKIPMVSLKDISDCCAKFLLGEESPIKSGSSPGYLKLFGPRSYSSIDLQNAVKEVTGKDVGLKAIEKDQLYEFFANEIPEKYVQEFVDMTTAGLPGGIIAEDFVYDGDTFRGRVELVDTLRQLYAK